MSRPPLVIACGPGLTEDDRQAIAEFQQYLHDRAAALRLAADDPEPFRRAVEQAVVKLHVLTAQRTELAHG